MTARPLHGDWSVCGRRTPAVLLVDAVRDNRAAYAEFLRAEGVRVIEADNTADALALARTADAIVTGIRVPGTFDGLELVRRIRADERAAGKAVIVLTACAFPEDARRAYAAGCDGFLAKPCLPDALAVELRMLLARRFRAPSACAVVSRTPAITPP